MINHYYAAGAVVCSAILLWSGFVTVQRCRRYWYTGWLKGADWLLYFAFGLVELAGGGALLWLAIRHFVSAAAGAASSGEIY